MALALEPGGQHEIHDTAQLAAALRGWGDRPDSFVVLTAPSGRSLQAAGHRAAGFELQQLEAGDEQPQTLGRALDAAELLRRLQAFAAAAGAGGDDAAWRQGLRPDPAGDAAAAPSPSGWQRHRQNLRGLLLMMLFPLLPLAVGLWGELEGWRYRQDAAPLQMRLVARESIEVKRRTYTLLKLSYQDAQGQTRRLDHIGRRESWLHLEPGDTVTFWQRKDGSGPVRETPPNGHLGLLLAGVFFLGVLRIWWRGRLRPTRVSASTR